MYSRDGIVTFEGGSYICLPSESNGPNLLDELLKGFIVTPVCSPWKCFGSYKPGHMGITTHSESVQPLQSAKLVYYHAHGHERPWNIYGIDVHYELSVYTIHYSCLH